MFTDGQRRVPPWSERSRFSLFPPPPPSPPSHHQLTGQPSPPHHQLTGQPSPPHHHQPTGVDAHRQPPAPASLPKAQLLSVTSGHSSLAHWRLSASREQPAEESPVDELDLDAPTRTSLSPDSPPNDSTTTTHLASSSSSRSSRSSASSLDAQRRRHPHQPPPPPTHLFLAGARLARPGQASFTLDAGNLRKQHSPYHNGDLTAPNLASGFGDSLGRLGGAAPASLSRALPTIGALLSSKSDLHFQPPAVRPQYPAGSPLWLQWEQLSYDLKRPTGPFYRLGRLLNLSEFSEGEFGGGGARRRRILQPQSGQFVGGSVNAIIGASGAGKSTLLECLSGRRRAGLSGQVRLHRDPGVFDGPLQVAYLPQTEALIPVLTVRETLLFASKLKNHRKLRTHAEHLQLVRALLDELRLHECADTRVQQVSGGQRKRVAIAAELISGPDVILLDEPTSGLDSCTAYLLVRLLRGLSCLARQRSQYRAPIVACSIHQPSAQLLTLFHGLYVLSSDGRCIFQGSPKALLPHLTALGLHCPPYQDPVAFITEIASGQLGQEPLERLAEAHASGQQVGTLMRSFGGLPSGLAGGFAGEFASGFSVPHSSGFSTNLFNGLPFGLAAVQPPAQPARLEHTPLPAPGELSCMSDESWDWPQLKPADEKPTEPHGQPAHAADAFAMQPPSGRLQTERMSQAIRRMRDQPFPFFRHSLLLIRRTYLGTIREPKLTWLRISQTLFIGLLMSFLYDRPIGQPDGCRQSSLSWMAASGNRSALAGAAAQRGSIAATTDHTTHENVAFVFFVTLFLVMSSMMPTVLTFPSEVRVLVQERANGYYACGSYYLAKVVADTPFVVLNAALFCSLVYPLTGQLMLWPRFALFAALANLVALIAHCIGMLFGTIYVHSVTSAVFMAPLSMSPVFLLSGFFGKIAALPMLLKPIAYLSYVRYVFECFLIALYGFGRCAVESVTPSTAAPAGTPAPPVSQALVAGGDEARAVLTQALPNELLRNLSAYLPPGADSQHLWSRLQDDLWSGLGQAPADAANRTTTAALEQQVQLQLNRTGSYGGGAGVSMVLDYYNLRDEMFMDNILILSGCFLFLRVLAYLILVMKTNRCG